MLTPWSGDIADYREVDGLLVPHQMIASWDVGGQHIPYLRFLVERLEFDPAAPF